MALNCVYHPTQQMKVVEDDEKEQLLATGVWFDHPRKAKDMRQAYERQITEGRSSNSSSSTKQRKRKLERS